MIFNQQGAGDVCCGNIVAVLRGHMNLSSANKVSWVFFLGRRRDLHDAQLGLSKAVGSTPDVSVQGGVDNGRRRLSVLSAEAYVHRAIGSAVDEDVGKC